MYTNTNAYNSLMDILGTNKSGKANGSSDVFDIGASFKEMLANKSGMQDILDKLAERFPGANVVKGKPENGIPGTDKFFGKEAGDFAAIEENLLAAMTGNDGLANQVQKAIEDFFNSTAGASGMEGAYTQRSISISITLVRMNVSQRAEGSGDLLSSQEMQTAFQEQLQKLINRFFGIEPAASIGTEAEAGENGEADETGAVDESNGNGKAHGHDKDKTHGHDKDKTGNGNGNGNGDLSGGYGSAGFSFEMFFASGTLSLKGFNSNGTQDERDTMSTRFGMSAGSFQGFATGGLTDLLGQFMGQGQGNQMGGNGPFTSLLNGQFSQFGMSVSSFSMSASGASIFGGNSKNPISDMLDYLMGSRNNSYENDNTPEAESVTEIPKEQEAIAS